jgi:hypothetical protein
VENVTRPWYELRPIISDATPPEIRAAVEPKVKRCSKCGAHHPVYKFNNDRGQADGLSHQCRPCQIETRRKSAQKMKARRHA